jgi:hypothetical protein
MREEQQIAGNEREGDQEDDEQGNHDAFQALLRSTNGNAICSKRTVRNIA